MEYDYSVAFFINRYRTLVFKSNCLSKPKPIQLQVPKPCHEDWDKMSPSQKGKFCSSCQKEVIDFSNWSDTALYHFFAQQKGNVCGRFKNIQLNKDFNLPSQPQSHLYKIFVSLGLTLLFTSTKSFAQSPKQQNTQVVELSKRNQNKNITINGHVVDEGNYPVNNALVGIYNLHNNLVGGCETEPDGSFTLTVSRPVKKGDKIVVQHTNYNYTEYSLSNLSKTISLTVRKSSSTSTSDSEIVVTGAPIIPNPRKGTSIRGKISHDGRPVSTAEVQLSDSNNKLIKEYYTDNTGNYSFTKLKPGKYIIECRQHNKFAYNYILTVGPDEIHTVNINSLPRLTYFTGEVSLPKKLKTGEFNFKYPNAIKRFLRTFRYRYF